jgi:hypothetical protein
MKGVTFDFETNSYDSDPSIRALLVAFCEKQAQIRGMGTLFLVLRRPRLALARIRRYF